jgi:hypothetical protein
MEPRAPWLDAATIGNLSGHEWRLTTTIAGFLL